MLQYVYVSVCWVSHKFLRHHKLHNLPLTRGVSFTDTSSWCQKVNYNYYISHLIGPLLLSNVVSFPSSLVGFWGFHPYMRLCSFRRLFWDLFRHVVFLGMVREKRGGRGGRGEDTWSVKYECTLLCCSQRTKSCCKRFQWNCESNHQTSLQKKELLLLRTTCAQLCGIFTFLCYNSHSNTYVPYNTSPGSIQRTSLTMFCDIPPDVGPGSSTEYMLR